MIKLKRKSKLNICYFVIILFLLGIIINIIDICINYTLDNVLLSFCFIIFLIQGIISIWDIIDNYVLICQKCKEYRVIKFSDKLLYKYYNKDLCLKCNFENDD